MIGCPVRNRAWILPRYLEHLSRLDFPRERLQYCFVINDCSDGTAGLLEDYAGRSDIPVRLIYTHAAIPTRRLSFPGSVPEVARHSQHQRGNYSFTALASLRNLLLKAFLESDCKYLFSLDSDILVPPQVLKGLMQNDCQVVSALVCNGHQLGDQGIYNILKRVGDHYEFIRSFPRDRSFEVDCTGAAYLIRRDVIEDLGVVYSAEKGGEDIGFCETAVDRGIKIYCDGRLECQHIMNNDMKPEVKTELR